jgi:methionine synthase II (cobalamin-independent)
VSRRATPPFRADHVGSLLRPPELIRARAAFADGAIDANGLRDAEDTAIREVVALQEDIGLRSATDGEFRRTSWHMDFIYQLGGISRSDEQLQLDDTSLAYLNDPAQRQMIAERGDDAQHQDLRYIKQLNAALEARPPGMVVTTHSCRGNFQSYWAAESGYDFVAEALFNELNVDGFFLEYDGARSGDFKPLRFMPKDKVVVLGLVTTKRGELEDKDDLKRRIDDASAHVPLEQICLSPQCGFSSTVEGNRLSFEDEVLKLRLIVETASEVWG